MTQQKQNGKLIAIITMIFLFGMISFVTNLAAPMGIVLKNQFFRIQCLRNVGQFRQLHCLCSNGNTKWYSIAESRI